MNEEETSGLCDNSCKPESIVDVFSLINTLSKKYEKLKRNNIQELELTPAQYFILSQLWESDGQQFKELAEKCGCSRSTITGVVDTMEKKMIVTRELHPSDRRSLLVKLTKKGKNLKNETPPLESILDGCCPEINEEEMKKLGELLQKLLNSLKY
ncbi:MAG: MarR family winged helix-turn-helix transcriptional regulator [Promethearchaeota archaeon]